MQKKTVLRIIALTIIMLAAVQMVFAASSRKDIDKFLKSYEELVVSVEKAAKKNDISSLSKIMKQALEFSEKAEDIQDTTAWTLADSQKYLDLTNRYTAAYTKLAGNMYGTDTDMSAYGL